MVSFSRCVLAISALLLAVSSASAQILTPGSLGGVCLAGNTCLSGFVCLGGVCTVNVLPSGASSGTGASTGSLGGVCTAAGTCNTGLSCIAGVCTIGTILPAGSIGGTCLAGNTCNSGLSCIAGICTISISGGGSSSSGTGVGTLGGACTAAGTCNAGLQCYLGLICSVASGLAAGTEGGACLATGLCNTGLSCIFNICASTGGSIIPSATCKANADCGLKRCVAGACVDWIAPSSTDCSVSGGATGCAVGTTCRQGVCAPTLASTCATACNTAGGETCVFGSCIQTTTPTCAGCNGLCLPTIFGSPQCISTGTTQCTSSADCSNSNICNLGYCQPGGNFLALLRNNTAFANVQNNLIAELSNIGAALNAFTSIMAAADVRASIAAGALNAAAGALIQIDASVTGLQNLNFAGANAAARIEANVNQTLAAISATAQGAQLLVGVGARTAASELNIAAGAAFAISMGAANAVTGAAASITQFAKLTLNGPLSVAGDINSVFTFPASASQVTVASGSVVKVSGGLALTGNAGTAPITLTASGSLTATAKVNAAAYFETAANILGTTGSFNVAGNLAFSGNVIEPRLVLSTGAKVSIGARDGATQATLAGDVSFSTTAVSGLANLVVNGTTTAGANLYFKEIKNCPSSALITYNVVGTASAALATGFTLFNYAVSTYANSNTFYCRIQVCGSLDGVCVEIKNPNNPSASGRRLLADSGSAVSFTPTSATVSPVGGVITGGSASQIKIASTLFAIIAAFVVALVYKL